MSNKIIKIDGEGMTWRSIEKLETMIENRDINPDDFTKAHLCYNAHIGFGHIDTPEFYPLKFESDKGIELWISYVTAGYYGTGPAGTQKILRIMGFENAAENQKVLFEKKITDEIFYKNRRFVLKCAVKRNGVYVCEYPYSIKLKE